ncbi:hypothetical protein [Halorubrum sp. 48-1-W]|uniref:hypothetical protein n=1 Tax=Halorubrum sp. 48-1-W TaxID=2249761 RepID=UPI000FC9ABAE|nr:hypothetical protein [Halorubrum sp. 48-1-W]
MSDEIEACPHCGSTCLAGSGRETLWCQDCEETISRADTTRRERCEWVDRSPTRGLAAKLDAAEPDEVAR